MRLNPLLKPSSSHPPRHTCWLPAAPCRAHAQGSAHHLDWLLPVLRSPTRSTCTRNTTQVKLPNLHDPAMRPRRWPAAAIDGRVMTYDQVVAPPPGAEFQGW